MMPTLFDIEGDDLDLGYENIRTAAVRAEQVIKNVLDEMWEVYEPFADPQFKIEFARNMDERFWEMFLATQLLEGGKTLRPQSELSNEQRGVGPDICCLENNRKIWIEATTPGPGDDNNLDQVPRIVTISEGGMAQVAPRREVELRISGALFTKKEKFKEYKQAGVITEGDICIVAISTAKFRAQSGSLGLSPAITAVFPLGDEYITFDTRQDRVVETGRHFSLHIERTGRDPIERWAFLNDEYCDISGTIWSRFSIGSIGMTNDLLHFLHNPMANNSLPFNWFNWTKEHAAFEDGQNYELRPID